MTDFWAKWKICKRCSYTLRTLSISMIVRTAIWSGTRWVEMIKRISNLMFVRSNGSAVLPAFYMVSDGFTWEKTFMGLRMAGHSLARRINSATSMILDLRTKLIQISKQKITHCISARSWTKGTIRCTRNATDHNFLNQKTKTLNVQ